MEKSELSCADKLVFDTKRQAEDAATALKWQKGIKLKPYQCQDCGLWHLSSS